MPGKNIFLPVKWKIYQSEFFLSKKQCIFILNQLTNCWIYRWIRVRFCRWEIVECDLFCLKLSTRHKIVTHSLFCLIFASHFLLVQVTDRFIFLPAKLEIYPQMTCRRVLIYSLTLPSWFDFHYSNIQEFCGYIKQLPSLEEKILKAKKVHITRKTRDSGEDV